MRFAQSRVVKHKPRNRNGVGRLAKMSSERKHKAKSKDNIPVIDDTAVITPDIPPAVIDQVLGEAVNPPTPVVCPLCQKQITVDEALFNMKELTLNNRPVQVHKNCPADERLQEEIKI